MPSLRHLVILDPQWVIDAVTCFVRDFQLKDHSTEYARMKDLDQRAIREEPEAWELLTGGRATLQKKLLHILWSAAEFREQQPELLDLLTRFGLAIPVPSRPSEFLIPSLLRDAALRSRPEGWPQATGEASELRIFFELEDPAAEGGRLLCTAAELEKGFLPIGVFHRLCAGALGSSYQASTQHEATLDRNHAYVIFDSTLVTLTYVPADSSVLVALDGKAGAAATIADQIRVLLLEELSAYQHLKHKMLAPVPGGGSWVDLDELTRAPSDCKIFLEGEHVSVEVLKDMYAFWLTTQCSFNFVLADKLRNTPACELAKFPTLQELSRSKPDWLVRKVVTFDGVLSGAYESEYLALSYRWETGAHPDPHGTQLQALQAHLKAHQTLKYVFVDYMCLAQGSERTPREKADFKMTLPNINLLYLGASVLVVMFDKTYMERFWPQFEAWLAFMRGDKKGLLSTPEEKLRCTVVCLRETPVWYASALKDRWLHCDSTKAHRLLAEPWVAVTNESDKNVQLAKIWHIDYMARRQMCKLDAAPTLTLTPAAPQPGQPLPPDKGKEPLLSKVARIRKELALGEELPMATVIEKANGMMDMKPEGGLPAQADALLAALGI